ncbi:hypothetical protein DTL21_24845 [Bremerella cremea]|uniref:Uncharacterized protein n=1 Tax=Blastopirellula marina TaxID=124 RepID=A0A2S8FAW1_9BACT|nr:hypothetical protein C5Y83_24800 [Blastopirellula marina]RCS42610.1 hypothetical protein DTL21_24845 [Bremerella cremea]
MQHEGLQQLRSLCFRWWNKPHFLAQGSQHDGSGAQQVGSGAQQVGSGAQQVGSGAQQVGSGAQHEGLQQLRSLCFRWWNKPHFLAQGSQHDGSGAQQVGSGAQQEGSGAQPQPCEKPNIPASAVEAAAKIRPTTNIAGKAKRAFIERTPT